MSDPNETPEKSCDEANDQRTRQQIRDQIDRNFMVEAAAGTGKTTSIVDRMVNLIGRGACQIEHLAAVTFTRKAAAELRERFQAELSRRAAELQNGTEEEQACSVQMQRASDHVGRAFVGTIHSFCAVMLRERPIEFGVEPLFRELSEEEDLRLRDRAWHENIDDLFASGDALIDKIDELGLQRQDLRSCFDRFIEYRDVVSWPCVTPDRLNVGELQETTRAYIEEMEELIPCFPVERGNDQLMTHYENIVRAAARDWQREGDFFSLLEKMNRSRHVVQKQWHDKAIAKEEKHRFNAFRDTVVKPALQWWCRKRYEFVVQFVRRAVDVYDREKAASGGLDFTDLLLTTAQGLKTHPELRQYFQTRFTHLLVDEFQDTDPIQAEMILYLTSENMDEQNWRLCKPRRGSLFLVGDPKQSIYRFRRGDIVTYNSVKEIFESSGGEVLSLTRNFRSRAELRIWNNDVYRDKFRAEADQYVTASEDMLQGRNDASDGDLHGLRKLTLTDVATLEETTRAEADAIARFIRYAIDSKMTVPRSPRDLARGQSTTVQPCDFLIVPRGKKRITLFKEALDRHSLPCEVTGGNAFMNVKQLGVLLDCLRAIDDPHHPVHYLAIMRHRLFAFSDAELYDFKKEGGRFSFNVNAPDALDDELKSRFDAAHALLRRYQKWLRLFPFSTAVKRIASDLGLLASAAAEREGNVALGGFLKAIENLRQRSCDFDSASDLIGYLEDLEERDESEGCTALPPDPNVVRVMNLHKAKGLEAPIVFLADTARPYGGMPICHIDRTGDEPVGYMGITARYSKYQTRDVATPEDWKSLQQEEQRFLKAEEDRLLYVATTRAACMLVVSVGTEKSSWGGLHRYLQQSAELPLPSDADLDNAAPKIEDKAITPPASMSVAERWGKAMEPAYAIETAKEAALKGASRPQWESSGEYGYKWGSAIHELLEIATKTPSANMEKAATLLASRFELGSERIEELLDTIRSVTGSDIWRRSQAASRRFSELPIETLSQAEQKPVITRGVIDLIFEEPDGWVIVDYKTDDISEADLPSAVQYYRRQLDHYGKHWRDMTAFQVSELGLYFTRIDRYAVVSP